MERVEWQADFYASCLLMPRRLVHAEWHERLGRTKPLLLSDLRPNGTVLMRAETLIREQGKARRSGRRRSLEVAERIARRFGVYGPPCVFALKARAAAARGAAATTHEGGFLRPLF